jgi:hypothetical protein
MQAHLHSGKDGMQIPRTASPTTIGRNQTPLTSQNAAIVATYATGGYSYQESPIISRRTSRRQAKWLGVVGDVHYL